MWGCGVVQSGRVLRFLWRQDYSKLLPPAAVSAYVRGQLCQGANDDNHNGGIVGVPVVVESPSDATGVFAFTAHSTERAVGALRDIIRSAAPLSRARRVLVIEGLAALLEENADLLSSADALAVGMCLRDARRSVSDAVNFLAFCSRRLQANTGTVAEDGVESAYVEDVFLSLGCYWSSKSRSNTTFEQIDEDIPLTLCLSAANYPLQWGIETIATAVLRGGTAVWLPPLEAPLSALWLIHLLRRRQKDVGGFPTESVNIILCRAEDVVQAFTRQLDGNMSFLCLTNGFSCQEARRVQHLCTAPVGSWHHRVTKPSLAVVGLTHTSEATGSDVSLDALHVAERICEHAFGNNGRTLHPLHTAFVPQTCVLSVLRCVVQRVREMRVGHSLDPTAHVGPLPGAAHFAAMRDTVEAAVCCGAVRLQHVCGGFEIPMPAGFFCVPCAFYGSVATAASTETASCVRAVCETSAQLRSDLSRLGGGPLVVVCGYDPRRQRRVVEDVLLGAVDYVVHRW